MLLAALLAVSAPPAEALERGTDAPHLRVELRDGRLGLEVVDRPWAELLPDLSRQTGIVFHLRPQPQGSVTASFKDLPIERALRRLFGLEANFIFHYDASRSSAVPAEVWVFGKNSRAPATMSAQVVDWSPAAAPEAVANRIAEIRALAKDTRAAGPALRIALRDLDPVVRKETAVALAEVRDDSAVEALATSLEGDSDLEVRATAVEALARIGSPRALIAVRQALSDPEMLIRIRAVEALASIGGEPAMALLREVVHDGNEELQSVAASLISRLETQTGQEQ